MVGCHWSKKVQNENLRSLKTNVTVRSIIPNILLRLQLEGYTR